MVLVVDVMKSMEVVDMVVMGVEVIRSMEVVEMMVWVIDIHTGALQFQYGLLQYL